MGNSSFNRHLYSMDTLKFNKIKISSKLQIFSSKASTSSDVLMPIYGCSRNISTSSTNFSITELVLDNVDLDTARILRSCSIARYIRGSPSKFRRVLDTIRGIKYEEALMILEYMPYRSCGPILKCLISSASNAKNNFGMKKGDLYVATTYCDMGPILKRYQPRAQGKGYKIKKPLSHITIELAAK